MEDNIKKLNTKLMWELLGFFLVIVAVASLGATGIIPNGLFVGKEWNQTAYIINIVAVAMMFISLWVALRLFRLNTENNLKRYTLDNALRTYHVWSIIRLVVLLVAVCVCLLAFFLTQENTGLFAAAVLVLMCLIFCVPSKKSPV